MFSGIVIQHCEQLSGNRFDTGLALDERFHARRKVAVNELHELFTPALVKLANDCNVLDLLLGKFWLGPAGRGEDIPGINEEDAIVGFGFVKKPERGRERNGVEHVGWQGQYGIDEVLLDRKSV